MATRQEIQIALDLIKFTNTAQDLFNNYSKIAKGEIQKTVSSLPDGNQTQEDMTVDDIKTALIRGMQNITNYNTMIRTFLSSQDKRAIAISGLTALDVDLGVIETDVGVFEATVVKVSVDTSKAIDKTALTDIGNNIDTDIPNLSLVRNR